MTIFLMTGTPGSGKSLHMAAILKWRLKRKLPTICNFEIAGANRLHGFACIENDDLTCEYLEDFARDYFADKNFREGAIKLYIDECQLLFNARTWNDAKRKDWIKFFTQHRKLGYDVYLIAQFDTMIDKQLRALIEYEIKHRKLNNYGWVGRIASLLVLGRPVVVAVTYWYPMKQRISSEWIIGRKGLFKIYDTSKIFGTA